MRTLTLFLVVSLVQNVQAQPLNFTVSSSSFQFSLTCSNPQISLFATSNYSSLVNYAWSGTNFSSNASSVTMSNAGNYIVTASSGSISSTKTISIATNTTPPVCLTSSTFQISNATVTAQVFTFTSISPTINITQYTYNPFGFQPTVSGGYVAIFSGIAGTYTHCIVDNINGCSTCLPFVITNIGPVIGTTTTSIVETHPEKIGIFPNPNNGVFKISAKSLSVKSVEIYNNIGALIHAEEWQSDKEIINIQNEYAGIYIVKITEDNGRSAILKMIRE